MQCKINIVKSIHIGWFYFQALQWRYQIGGITPNPKNEEEVVRNTINFIQKTQHLN